jgi:microcystin-dependent protein
MVYTKSTWISGGVPAISSVNLNNLETQYDSAIVIGEIKMFCGTVAPTDFFLCNGTSKEAAVYPALFAITSHYYGGDATWFHLPNLMGQFIAGYSSNAGDYATIGVAGGTSNVTLNTANLPAHHHHFYAYAGADIGGTITPEYFTGYTAATITAESAGGGTAHENRPPYVVVNYIIRYQ